MKRNVKKVVSLSMALVLSLMLCACGNSASNDAGNAQNKEETGQEQQEAAKVSEEVETKVEDAVNSDFVADSVNIALTADDVEFSPWSGNDGGRGYNVWLMYQPLCWLVDGEMVNCLIKSYELIDAKTCQVTLYDYIKDSKGREVKASDVVFSYEKAQEEGRVKGATFFETATAVDDYTVEFTFKKDLALGELEQTFSQVYIVNEETYNEVGDGMLLNPVGTGRYVLSDYVSGASITFTENENYWQTEENLITVRDQANVKEITFYVISEAAQRAIAVEEGTVDYADITLDSVDNVAAAGKHIYEYPNTLTYFLAPNCSENSILANEALRKAVFYAIDSNALAAGLTSTTGFPVYDMLCSNYADYVDAFESENNFYTEPSLEKAAEYLAEAGYNPGEVTLNLICESNQIPSDMATMIQALLQQIGINVQINTYQSNMVTSYLEDPTGWDMFIGVKADNLYLVNAWANVLYRDNYAWDGSQNFIFDDELQNVLAEARALDTHDEEHILACHDYIVDKAYIRGLVGYYSQYAYSEKFESLFYNEKGFLAPNCSTYKAN